MSYEQLLARVKQLETAETERVAKEQRKANTFALGNKLTARVSAKGGISVYGLGKWPVTLYFEQWKRLLGVAATLMALLDKLNAAGKLAVKADDGDGDGDVPDVQ